jgi:hypothetical protein
VSGGGRIRSIRARKPRRGRSRGPRLQTRQTPAGPVFRLAIGRPRGKCAQPPRAARLRSTCCSPVHRSQESCSRPAASRAIEGLPGRADARLRDLALQFQSHRRRESSRTVSWEAETALRTRQRPRTYRLSPRVGPASRIPLRVGARQALWQLQRTRPGENRPKVHQPLESGSELLQKILHRVSRRDLRVSREEAARSPVELTGDPLGTREDIVAKRFQPFYSVGIVSSAVPDVGRARTGFATAGKSEHRGVHGLTET